MARTIRKCNNMKKEPDTKEDIASHEGINVKTIRTTQEMKE